jgi:hypothetical protein
MATTTPAQHATMPDDDNDNASVMRVDGDSTKECDFNEEGEFAEERDIAPMGIFAE